MNTTSPCGRFQSGITLTEILVTLSIATILASMTIPGFNSLLMSNRATALSNSLLTAMHVARSEAVKRNKDVTFCKSNDSSSCSGSWSDGWILFSDHDGDRLLDADDGDELISIYQLSSIDFDIVWNGFRSDNFIRFSPQGFIYSNNGTFTLCPPGENSRHARAVIINRLGRARISKDNDHDGIHEDGYGRPIDCT
jgi:type IV fimbrial biogenesis protein FimT